MRKIRWLQGAVALAVVAAGTSALAADHIDGPAVKMDPAADITDVYAWKEVDNVLLVLNVAPFAAKDAKFSDAIQYVWHIESTQMYGEPSDSKLNVICTFDAAQKISCWVGDKDYVTGDASSPDGLKSESGDFRVFAGVRADPFYFNLDGFKDAVNTVDAAAAAGTLMPDGAGCPQISAATSTVLVKQLQGTAEGTMPAKNFFETGNVLSIVMEVKASLLTDGGPILAIWGSTNRAGG